MKSGNDIKAVSLLRSHGTEACAESIIAAAAAYSAPLPPENRPDLAIFYIHNIAPKVREIANDINEHQVVDTSLIEAQAKEIWMYRVNSLSKPPMVTCPGLETWNTSCWDSLRDLKEMLCKEFGAVA